MRLEGTAILTAETENGTPSITGFLLEHGRLPFIDDPVKPWAYRGWLLPYRMMLENHPDITPRYDYVIRTIENQALLDEPIPQTEFCGEFDKDTKDGFKMLEQMIGVADRVLGYHRAFEAVVEWLAFALGVSAKASDLADKDQEELYRMCDLSKWLLSPTDYLGSQMAENHIGKRAGFYPTPMQVCTLMAKMVHAGEDLRTAKAHDPAVGTGRTLLAASNYCLRLYGQDISYIAVLACKINLALYAPWHHIPASFFPDDPPPEQVLPPAGEEKPLFGALSPKSGGTEEEDERRPQIFSTETGQPTLFKME